MIGTGAPSRILTVRSIVPSPPRLRTSSASRGARPPRKGGGWSASASSAGIHAVWPRASSHSCAARASAAASVRSWWATIITALTRVPAAWDRSCGCLGGSGVDKELDVAVGTMDRRGDPAGHGRAQATQRLVDLAAHAPVHLGIGDHTATLRDLLPPGLELRLHEHDEVATGTQRGQ